MSCPVSVYCDGVCCHVLCLYTVMGWGVMSCVYMLWRCGVLCPVSVNCGGVASSCPVSVNCDGIECHVLCLHTVMGGVSCPVYVHCDRVGCHALCLYTFTEHYLASGQVNI